MAKQPFDLSNTFIVIGEDKPAAPVSPSTPGGDSTPSSLPQSSSVSAKWKMWVGDWDEDQDDPIPQSVIRRAIHCLFNPNFKECDQWYRSQPLTVRFIRRNGRRMVEDTPPDYNPQEHPWETPHVPKPDDNCKKCLGIGWKDKRIPNSLLSERAFCDCWK